MSDSHHCPDSLSQSNEEVEKFLRELANVSKGRGEFKVTYPTFRFIS